MSRPKGPTFTMMLSWPTLSSVSMGLTAPSGAMGSLVSVILFPCRYCHRCARAAERNCIWAEDSITFSHVYFAQMLLRKIPRLDAATPAPAADRHGLRGLG